MIDKEDNQLDRLIKVALVVLESIRNSGDTNELIDMFPDHWDGDYRNSFLDQLLIYCADPDREMWEQAAIIRAVKKKINE